MFLLLLFQFTEIMFVDHQTGNKAYFKRQVNQSITAAHNYGNGASSYGKWNSVGANNAYHITSCWSAIPRSTLDSSSQVTRIIVSRCVITGAVMYTRLTSVRRQLMHVTWAWLSTRMVITPLATDSLALVCDKSHLHSRRGWWHLFGATKNHKYLSIRDEPLFFRGKVSTVKNFCSAETVKKKSSKCFLLSRSWFWLWKRTSCSGYCSPKKNVMYNLKARKIFHASENCLTLPPIPSKNNGSSLM